MNPLEEYRNEDLVKELRRRHSQGRDLVKYFTLQGERKFWIWRDHGAGLRPGSKRDLRLKYKVSDEELMREIVGRIVQGNGDLCLRMNMFFRSLKPEAEDVLRIWEEELDKAMKRRKWP